MQVEKEHIRISDRVYVRKFRCKYENGRIEWECTVYRDNCNTPLLSRKFYGYSQCLSWLEEIKKLYG